MTADDDSVASGWSSLQLVAAFHQMEIGLDSLRHEFGAGEPNKEDLARASARAGFHAHINDINWLRLGKLPVPVICMLRGGGYGVLGGVRRSKSGETELIIRLAEGSRVVSLAEARELLNGTAIFLTPQRPGADGKGRKFGFSWFFPLIVKYRRHFGEVLIASLVVQIFALATPLFFQVVMDKVVVHRSETTLGVLALGIFFIYIFDFALDMSRSYLLMHTTNRMDARLGSNLYRHLVRLPQSYFENRPVGSSVARVRELESIRDFLTSSMTTTLLDVLFIFVFIAVMLHYSLFLTGVVLASLPCYALLTIALMPVLRARLMEKFRWNAANQSLLVESISGISSLKSHAVEHRMSERWESQQAAYVHASFKASHTANIGSKTVKLISTLTTLGIMYLGAGMVMAGEMTIGQLIAFNMFAGRVSSPVIRLAQLWQDYQQVGVAIKRLGDILDTPTEVSGSLRSDLPPIRGKIEFRDVEFRYLGKKVPALKGINLTAKPGQRIGIVGESGSGKSTLVKLLLKFYAPLAGRLLVDDIDLALANPEWIRRQCGVVEQDGRLFAATIRQNIALADGSISVERVMEAAKQAGAHGFIAEQENGYETQVEENGANFSGGQRQRICLARALATDPRILVLDEATSALDYESEKAIQDNMDRIARGRTVMIVSHRLSAVKDCDRIVVMHAGEIVESGTHEELKDIPGGYYARLWELQQA